jgi:indole-3-glycerol phosphate synthase
VPREIATGRGISALRPSHDLADNSIVNILDAIVAEKQREVARLPQRVINTADLRASLMARNGRRDFVAALHGPGSGRVALIAEVKKASPSAGVICRDFDPVRIAREYEKSGASCLSVLTDEKFFQGSLEYLRQIRWAVKLPLLRKDFIIDERQILEAIEWGADAVLLIAAILDQARLERLYSLATEAGLAALVEVHDAAELDRALAVGAELVGVNNRNLKTFKVDLATTERLAARLFPSRVTRHAQLLVAESGIHSRTDVERLANCGVRAILVGESLMKSGDIAGKARELLGRT